MTEMHFFFGKPKKYHAWLCQNVCDALTFLLDNIFIRFGTKLYRQVVGIPMCTNCAHLVADLFLFCYERDFMMSLSGDKQADVIGAFCFVCLFVVLLYVPSQQLWSLRDGQFT